MIDGNRKRNGCLNAELQSPDVSERRSKKIQPQVSFCMCVFWFCFCLFVCFLFLGGGGGREGGRGLT